MHVKLCGYVAIYIKSTVATIAIKKVAILDIYMTWSCVSYTIPSEILEWILYI